MSDLEHTIFLLSPAKLAGARGDVVLGPEAESPLARELRSGGVPLGELFSFVSSLYFRGKVAYARAFARPLMGAPGALVITPGEGLLPLDETFGYRLFFPSDFVRRGDMSRGGLMLRAASSGEELTYARVEGTLLHGPRPGKLTPRARS